MSNGMRCRCARCMYNGLMGPVVLITLGVLFLLTKMDYVAFRFGQLWPVLLIVIGLVKIAAAMASSEGHIGPGQLPPPAPPAQPAPPNPPGQPGQ